MDTPRPRAHNTEWFDDVLRATARRAGRGRSLTRDESARRSAAAVAKLGWQWPYWLERQLRATHAAFVPLGDVSAIENLTARTWATVGTIAAGALAVVDPAGFVMPTGGQWGLDWMVHAGGRWYVPAREAAVRQHAIDDMPVIETALRIPDGDAIHRVFGVPGEREFGDVVVIEIENSSPSPIAVALAIRPADCTGVGVIDALELDSAVIRINEQPALLSPRPPSGYAAGHAEIEDSLTVVATERASTDVPPRVTCAMGLANGAVVFPVAHRSTLRLVFAPRAPRRSTPRSPQRAVAANAVVRGWQTHLEQAAGLGLPDDALVRAYRAAVRRLLLTIDGASFTTTIGQPAWTVSDETAIVGALTRVGLGSPVAPILVHRMDDQRMESWARRDDASMSRNLTALDAIVTHWRLTRDVAVAHAVLVPAVRMAQWCGRRIERGGAAGAARTLAPLVGALADMARAVDQPGTGAEIDDFAAVIAWRVVRDAPTGGDAAVASTDRLHRGFDVRALLAQARREIDGEDLAGNASLVTAAAHLSPAGSWPSFVHPRLGSGSGGNGDDPLVCADFVEAVRALVVIEDVTQPELRLLPVLPDAWLGQSIDVARLPTFAGTLAYSVRWHGPNAALLWELDGPCPAEVRLSSPGLSRDWSSTARSGEALLVRHEE